MKYIDQYESPETSYWDVFPEHKTVKHLKDIYKADRSKEKNKSSKVMWYLVNTKDIDSDFYPMSYEDQKEIVSDMVCLDVEKYLGGKEKLEELGDFFEFLIDTALSADVRSLERKMIERQQFIKITPYTVDHMVQPETERIDENGETYMVLGKPYSQKGTAPQLDKMVTDTKKLHDEIRVLRESLKSEQAEQGKGGQERSFLES